ncbi:hypothetical protein H4R18_000128 [Coemansia javaensis]|uniref:GTP-binding protein 8 n=1 Tax=Coemansia javaensis TaxID=2761396 RepID=A0A9W8LNA3_9FUNG|nr:hypothetical protein H4R18_000128 [Coemansia javaensis]
MSAPSGRHMLQQGPALQVTAADHTLGFAARFFAQRTAEFRLAAVRAQDYGAIHQPEIALAGRSNVGKSSLINALLRTHRLARTSKTPGRTATLNFYRLASRAGPGELSLVDMPGYGFRSRDEWGRFVTEYLASRQELRRVFMLVEAKVGELKPTDASFLELVERHAVPTQIVLTKTDKLRRADLDAIAAAAVQAAARIAPTALQPRALCCSAHKRAGLEALQGEILRVCGIGPPGGA